MFTLFDGVICLPRNHIFIYENFVYHAENVSKQFSRTKHSQIRGNGWKIHKQLVKVHKQLTDCCNLPALSGVAGIIKSDIPRGDVQSYQEVLSSSALRSKA